MYVSDREENNLPENGLTSKQKFVKRTFDLFVAFVGLITTFWIIFTAWLLSSINTRKNGFFTQDRVGMEGRVFRILKIRTMKELQEINTNITTSKIDELPQLINVLKGEMSFVGPRPDVPGYADALEGSDRKILSVRPGITGPATLKYWDEESILANQMNPEQYNNEILWPDKVKLNIHYVENWSFWRDLFYIWETLFNKYDSKKE